MTSYTPEYTYGLVPGSYGQYGLIPWPAHLQPRETAIEPYTSSGIELTKKGEAYVATALAEAGGVFFLTLDRSDRMSIATTIDRLIDMLDAMEEDPDLEDAGDAEPSLGWCGQSEKQYRVNDDRELDTSDDEDGGDLEPTLGTSETLHGESQERWAVSAFGLDEVEEENEHGGDILDGPHDAEEDCCSAGEDMGIPRHYGGSTNRGARMAIELLRSIGLPAGSLPRSDDRRLPDRERPKGAGVLRKIQEVASASREGV